MTNFTVNLTPGNTYTNKELSAAFNVSNMGGMRYSKKNNALVLISDHTKGYDDHSEHDILYYTGMGKYGDQSLNFGQNKRLQSVSIATATNIYLFEVLKKTEYIYRGPVTLCQEPFQEQQLDFDEKPRKVWIFPLKIKQA